MRKVVFIVGPTAVGKTQLALDLSNKFDGETVSADSVQVYRGLDIISGKDLPPDYKLSNGYYISGLSAPIHLLDVVDPKESFNAAQFQNLAVSSIDSIHKRNKLPIIVGGTGLYVKALIDGLDVEAKPDLVLRKKLEGLTVSELQELIPAEILESMNNSDLNNPRRLIRKIETVGNKEVGIRNKGVSKEFESLVIGLKCDREVLKNRIDVRVESRLKDGALDEAIQLFENYENLSQQVKDANGYKQLFSFLKKELEWDEVIYRWKVSEYRHAKNQMTWFGKYGNVDWYDIENENFAHEIEDNISKFLK